MSRRKVSLIVAIMLLAALLPMGVIFADYTAEDCLDGEWEVRPDQTLYFIAYTCSVTVDALVAYNNIENPNLINTGDILLIPPPDFQPGDVPPAAPPAAPPQEPPPAEPVVPTPVPPPSGGSGDVIAEIAPPQYSGDGRVAEVNISVHNLAVTPKLAGGRYYPNAGPDAPGGAQWVTLLGAIHDELPHPFVTTELLWHTTVYTSDGLVFPAYAGCVYQESILAEGDEPLDRENDVWFHWEMELVGGWFDCGNAYQVKPEDMLPGQSGSAPLTVYLVHPRQWGEVLTTDRRITRIDLELFDTTGRSLGTVATRWFQ